jgi:hypothetical protein
MHIIGILDLDGFFFVEKTFFAENLELLRTGVRRSARRRTPLPYTINNYKKTQHKGGKKF